MSASNILVPKLKSPVSEAESPILYRWDSSVRKYFTAFELELTGLRQGIIALASNPLTKWKDPV